MLASKLFFSWLKSENMVCQHDYNSVSLSCVDRASIVCVFANSFVAIPSKSSHTPALHIHYVTIGALAGILLSHLPPQARTPEHARTLHVL